MKRLLIIFFSFFYALLPTMVGSQETRGCTPAPLLADADFKLNLAEFACVHVDATRSLALSDIIQPASADLFQPIEGSLIDFGFGTAQYWVQVDILNATQQPGTWWITHDLPSAENLQVHLLREGQAPQTLLNLSSGDTFTTRAIPYRHLLSAVSLEHGETGRLVISYVTGQATEMPLFAETPTGVFGRSQAETVRIIGVVALTFGMGLISAIYLYSFQGKQGVVYGAYVLTSNLVLFHMEGFTFQFVWPNAPVINHYALTVLSPLSIAFVLLFVSTFSNTSTSYPRLHKLTLLLVWLLCAQSLLSIWFLHSVTFKLLFLAVLSVAAVFILLLATLAVINRLSGSGMLLAGFGAIALALGFIVAGYLTKGLFPQELPGAVARMCFVCEAFAFSAAIALRIRALRRDHDAALRSELKSSQERLKLSEALRQSEMEYKQAAHVAQQSREALASAAHDIRQPLTSIQMALSSGVAAREKIESSLSYLDSIVRAGLEDAKLPLGSGDADPPDPGTRETFTAAIILENMHNMFGEDAERSGIDLRIVSCAALISTDPLSLMRIVSNLVSNALRHSGASRVIVGCRRKGSSLRVEVHDNGAGIAAERLTELKQRGTKSDTSDGHGLGLAIASELALGIAQELELASWPGKGTVARVSIPLAADHSDFSQTRAVAGVAQ